jgi:hypothetical protein
MEAIWIAAEVRAGAAYTRSALTPDTIVGEQAAGVDQANPRRTPGEST